MLPELFRIPFINFPVFGFGAMLVVAILVCPWVAARRAREEGISPDFLQNLTLWLVIGGIIGGRTASVLFEEGQNWRQFFKLWEGGLVFYGSLAGGLAAYVVAYLLVLRRHKISTLQLVDIVAPALALGLFFGRIGCFLSGCCYGDVADPARVTWGVRFPANSGPHQDVVYRGYQTAYGFILAEVERPPQKREADPRAVQVVEAGSPAEAAGLRPGDRIVKVGDTEIAGPKELRNELQSLPPRQLLQLTVERGDLPQLVDLQFQPSPSIPLHPAQLYSSLDGLIIFLFLMAYYPFRRQRGEVMALFMICYPITRFLIESLRHDTPRMWFNLTLSQNVSIIMLAAGIVMALWLRSRKPPVQPGRKERRSASRRVDPVGINPAAHKGLIQ